MSGRPVLTACTEKGLHSLQHPIGIYISIGGSNSFPALVICASQRRSPSTGRLRSSNAVKQLRSPAAFSMQLSMCDDECRAAMSLFQMPEQNVDLAFGVVTIGAAAVACLLGALAVDVMGSSVRSAMIFCGAHTTTHHPPPPFLGLWCSMDVLSALQMQVSAWPGHDVSATAACGRQ